ncbi:OprO/OprP family phosphate-selective porin [Blastopirellula sp. JC732]|uniref:OprO/OprP family phosphate-selective porin n=1 Tax=Blastopirellula sediminis TaxID=2894196 RepID=A0A9X1MJY6_9BACT|nr:porin [Blastopirellula sediminis]MCC9608700.1 OprO/OprP family phosphate-selective porin [Blastopirellula sediminis]MCC9628523.1 OprO/OprP family phosphate-selective porin [Blastopirellula sediminis]
MSMFPNKIASTVAAGLLLYGVTTFVTPVEAQETYFSSYAAEQYSAPPQDDFSRRLMDLERRIDQLDAAPPQAGPMSPPIPGSAMPNMQNIQNVPTTNVSHLMERIERLEAAQTAQSANLAKAMAEYEPPKKPTFKIGGRVHFDTWDFPTNTPGIGYFENPTTGDDPQNRWAFRRVRLETSGDIFETMLWRIQVDFADPSEPSIKDVYIGWDELPGNTTVLLGNQKRPLGLDHLNSSRYNIFMERPLVIEAFNEDARRLGLCAYSYSDDLVYNWRYGIFNLENVSQSGAYIGDAFQGSGNARLASSPWYDDSSDGRGWYHWAIAGMVANPDGDALSNAPHSNQARFRTRPEARTSSRWIDTRTIADCHWYEVLGVESMLNVGAWNFCGEYQANFLQRDNGRSDATFHGGYLQVGYFLTGEHMVLDRKSGTLDRVHPYENFFLVPDCYGGCGGGWGAWQVAARISYLDLTDQDIQGGLETNATLGLNWFWTSHSKMQFNAIYGDISEHAPVNGYTGGNFWILGCRFMVDF